MGQFGQKLYHRRVSGEKERRGAGGRFRSRETGSHRCSRFEQDGAEPRGRDATEGGLEPEPHHRGPDAESGRWHFVLKAAGKREAEAGLRGVCPEALRMGRRE